MPTQLARALAGALAILATAPQAASRPPSASAETRAGGADALEEAFESIAKTSSSRRRKLLARCLEAAAETGAPQVAWVEEWAGRLPEKLSRLDEPTEFEAHDSREYGGGPPRRTIGPGRNLWDDLRARLAARPADPRFAAVRPATYEFATGRLVAPDRRKRDEPGPEQPFRDLVAGQLPDQPLAEEALLLALDAAAPLREEARFFAHLYADREGNAYEGISLHDFWSSGQIVEVPDVDVSAYAQIVWDEEIELPLREEAQTVWYPRIQDSLRDLRTYLFTTRALAAVWFEGLPELSGGYANSVDILNGSIALCDGDAERVAEKLAAHGSDFLTQVRAEIDAQGNAVWNRGNARRDEVAAGKERIRAAVRTVLEEEGYLETE